MAKLWCLTGLSFLPLFSSPSDVAQFWIMSSIGIFWFCMLGDLSMKKYCEIEDHCINFKLWMTFLSLPQGIYCSNNWNIPVFWLAIQSFLIARLLFISSIKGISTAFSRVAESCSVKPAMCPTWSDLLFIGKIPKMAPAGQNFLQEKNTVLPKILLEINFEKFSANTVILLKCEKNKFYFDLLS